MPDFNQKYLQWLGRNKVGMHLDLKNPIYTPGRAPLGRLVEPKIKNINEWFQKWDKNYCFAGIFFS